MSSKRMQSGAILGGLGLLLIGGLVSAQAFGLKLPGLAVIWPAIPIAVGIAILAQPTAQSVRRSGLIFFGLISLLSGLLLCAFNFQVARLSWPQMLRYWPIFPVIIGFAFLMVYLAEDMEHEALLRPAYLIGGFGLFLLPITIGVVGGAGFQQIGRFWPLLLVPLGLLIGLQIMRSRGRGRPPGSR